MTQLSILAIRTAPQPDEQQRVKNGELYCVDGVRGLIEMTANLLVMDASYSPITAPRRKLVPAERRRIRKAIDAALPRDGLPLGCA